MTIDELEAHVEKALKMDDDGQDFAWAIERIVDFLREREPSKEDRVVRLSRELIEAKNNLVEAQAKYDDAVERKRKVVSI